MLFEGVYHKLETAEGELIPHYVGGEVNLGCVLAKSMTEVRNIKAANTICSMGGLVTPLLEYVGIDLTQFEQIGWTDRIDKEYMMRCEILNKTSGPEFVYRYWHRNTSRYEMPLPSPRHTAFTEENLRFEFWDSRYLAKETPTAMVRAPSEPGMNTETWELPKLRMKKNSAQKKFLVTAYQIQDRVNRLAKKQTSFLMKQFKKLKEKMKRVAGDRWSDSSEEEEMPEWDAAQEAHYQESLRGEDDFEAEFEFDEGGPSSH